jgi:hypothetical protein
VNQNGPIAQAVLSIQSVGLGVVYTKSSLMEARLDGLQQKSKFAMYGPAAMYPSFPALALLYVYRIKYGGHVVS